MCLNPIPIKNKNDKWVIQRRKGIYILKNKKGEEVKIAWKRKNEVINETESYKYKTDNPNLFVPCGHCAECLQKKQQNRIQLFRELSKEYYMYFTTLTYGDWILKDKNHTIVYYQTKEQKRRKCAEYYLKRYNKTELTNNDIERIRNFIKDEFENSDELIDTELETTYENLFINKDTGEIEDEKNLYRYTDHYANIEDIQKMVRRIRDNWKFEKPKDNLKYIFVSEYGKNTHRAHWHGILLYPKKNLDELGSLRLEKYLDNCIKKYWATKTGGTKKNPIYTPNSLFIKYNPLRPFGHYTYDFHIIREIEKLNGIISDESDVAYYVTKYTLKYDKWLERKQQALKINYTDRKYKEIWEKIKNKYLISKMADKICEDRITDMIEKTYLIYGYPKYINPDGSTYPLCERYKKKYITEELKERLDKHIKDKYDWNEDYDQYRPKTDEEKQIKKEKFKKLQESIVNM